MQGGREQQRLVHIRGSKALSHGRILSPNTLWKSCHVWCFRRIYSRQTPRAVVLFANDLLQEGAIVRNNYLEKLLTIAKEIVNAQGDPTPGLRLLDEWKKYRSYYQEQVEPLMSGENREKAQDSLKKLSSDPRFCGTAAVDLISVDFQNLCAKADEHIELFKGLDKDHEDVPAEQRRHFYVRMNNLEDSVRKIE